MEEIVMEERMRRPSLGQKTYITALARRAGLKVDVPKIESQEKALRLIEQLRLLNRRMNGSSFENEIRDYRGHRRPKSRESTVQGF